MQSSSVHGETGIKILNTMLYGGGAVWYGGGDVCKFPQNVLWSLYLSLF